MRKIIFLFSLIGILALIFITQTTKQTQEGTIKSIQISSNKITIQLENYSAELIIFDTNYLNLKKGDNIEFQGKRDTYKNKEQVIIDKIFIIDHQ